MAIKHALSPVSSVFSPTTTTFIVQRHKKPRTSDSSWSLSPNDNSVQEVTAPKPQLEQLPAELLQQIAWYAINPLIYLASKTIYSKLFDPKDYDHDLMCLLWCDRTGTAPGQDEKLGWAMVAGEDFPWRTSIAKRANPILSSQQRRDLQRASFQVEWFTASKIYAKMHELISFWIKYQWSADYFRVGKWDKWFAKNVDEPDAILSYGFGESLYFNDDHFEATRERHMTLNRVGRVNIFRADPPNRGFSENYTVVKHVLIDIMCLPSWLFNDLRCSRDDLLPLLSHCGPPDKKKRMRQRQVEFSKEKAMMATRRAIESEDWVAFIRLFCLFLNDLSDSEAENLSPSIKEHIFAPTTHGYLLFTLTPNPVNGLPLNQLDWPGHVLHKASALEILDAVKSLDDLEYSLVIEPRQLEPEEGSEVGSEIKSI